MMTKSKREHAYHQIRNAITYGELKPGERLIENKLCEIFKLGRTPLREALSQLQIEGYLDFVPNKGLTVSRMSIQNVKEIYDVIAVLEGYATEIATKYLNELDLKKLKLIHNSLKKASHLNDQKKWLDKNAVFHAYLVEACRNNFLYSIINSLRNRIYRYRLISITVPNSLKNYLSAHEKIMKNISKKDWKKAGREMQRHVLSVAKNLIKFLNQVPGF